MKNLDVPTPSVGVDPCECEAYPGGLCDGWCYAKSYTNMQYCALKRDRNRLQFLINGNKACAEAIERAAKKTP